MPVANKWDQVEKIFMRELTRSAGPSRDATTDATNAATAAAARGTLEAGHDCGLGSKLMDAQGNVAWRTLACYAAAVASMPQNKRDELISLLQAGSCLTLLYKYSGLSSVQCPAATQADPAYADDSSVSASSWNPFDPGAGAKWLPSQPVNPPPVPPTPALPPTPASSDSELLEKILMRELTRAAGQQATDAQHQEDAMYATNIRAMAVLGKCQVTQGWMGLVSQQRFAALACQFYLLATAQLPASLGAVLPGGGSARAAMLALLQSDRCNEAGMVTTAVGGLTPCPDQVGNDPAYQNLRAAQLASWNPYNPGAGTKYPLGSTPVPAPPATTDLTYNGCVAAMDEAMNDNEKQLTCRAATDPQTPLPALQLIRSSLVWRGFLRAAGFLDLVIASKQASVPGAPPGGLPLPNLGCTPFPACLAAVWPAGLPKPNMPDVNCQPFPGCLADAGNWSQSATPQQLGDKPYCTPWPDCLCQVPFVQPMCQGLPPLPQPTTPATPGPTPTGAEPATPAAAATPWYSTTGGKVGIAAAAVLLVGGTIVALA